MNMTCTVLEKKILSGDGVHMLCGQVFLPSGEPRGMVHIVHGMAEHIGRYRWLLESLADRGYIAFAFDLLGHGHTATDASELGFIAHKDGHLRLIRDVAVIAQAMKKEYGPLPYHLLGHSMGSFIVRGAVMTCITPDTLTLSGTAGPNPLSLPGLAIAGLIRLCKGPRHISATMDRLAFGSYSQRFAADNPHGWLSTDPEVRARYDADPLCGFKFTTAAMMDLMRLIRLANSTRWFRCVGQRFPVLLLSGSDDPVGDYGSGVQTVHRRLTDAGTDAMLQLYDGYRHEMFNEPCRDEVLQDFLHFLKTE